MKIEKTENEECSKIQDNIEFYRNQNLEYRQTACGSDTIEYCVSYEETNIENDIFVIKKSGGSPSVTLF